MGIKKGPPISRIDEPYLRVHKSYVRQQFGQHANKPTPEQTAARLEDYAQIKEDLALAVGQRGIPYQGPEDVWYVLRNLSAFSIRSAVKHPDGYTSEIYDTLKNAGFSEEALVKNDKKDDDRSNLMRGILSCMATLKEGEVFSGIPGEDGRPATDRYFPLAALRERREKQAKAGLER